MFMIGLSVLIGAAAEQPRTIECAALSDYMSLASNTLVCRSNKDTGRSKETQDQYRVTRQETAKAVAGRTA